MLIELSYPLSEGIPVYPGSPKEQFIPNTRFSTGDENNTTVITHYLHNGSHVDAPYHFDKDGASIDRVDISTYMFSSPLFIDCRKEKSGLITKEDILTYGEELTQADILLLCTGYGRIREDDVCYADDFPALCEEAAEYIRNTLKNVKAIAIDTLSIESATGGPANGFPVHRMLLHHETSRERALAVYEDIDLEKARGLNIRSIMAFPLRLVGLDGSPVTMVAEV